MKVSKYALRMCAVILIVGILDCLWVLFAPAPLPVAALIPATIPIWVSVVVIIPMLRDEKVRKSSR